MISDDRLRELAAANIAAQGPIPPDVIAALAPLAAGLLDTESTAAA